MSLLNTRALLLAAATTTTLFLSSTTAQTCYFPNGSEANHTACSNSSSSNTSGSEAACCSASDVCMDNGLCFGEGIVSRGSCTDKEWNSKACSQYCGKVSLNASIPIMACTNDGKNSKFICGMNTSDCKKSSAQFTLTTSDLTFRPSELDAIVNPAISSALAQASSTQSTAATITITALPTSSSSTSSSSNPNAIYTPSDMAGLGIALAIPLLITSTLALLLWKRDRARTPKLMYPLPDDLADPYTSIDGKPLHPGIITSTSAGGRPPPSRDGSILSFNTMKTSAGAGTPAHLQTFAERYQVMRGAQGGFQIARVELDGSEMGAGTAATTTPREREFEGELEMHDLKVPFPKEF